MSQYSSSHGSGHKLTYPQLISLIYGGHFYLFKPKGLNRDDEEYILEVFQKQFRYFGPYPAKIAEIASPETVQTILLVMENNPKEKLTPLSKMMKLDWRDRPTAKELLEDEWWNDDTA
jgi:hypothetical protein